MISRRNFRRKIPKMHIKEHIIVIIAAIIIFTPLVIALNLMAEPWHPNCAKPTPVLGGMCLR